MKICISGQTEIMWNTHRVGVTALGLLDTDL